MSRAFVKEQDGEPLPSEAMDLPVSTNPNLVTPRGFQRLEKQLADYERERDRLKAADRLEDKPHLERVEREVRYLKARLETAQITAPQTQPQDRVGFGATVTVVDADDKRHDYQIVGEDEADPDQGRVSYVSPLARALMGAKVGDSVVWRRPAGDMELEVEKIRY